jgi:gamma-glutamyltranspeptidase
VSLTDCLPVTSVARGDFYVSSMSAAVATDDPRCSAIGADILRLGGSAMDAAVAATLCLGVVRTYTRTMSTYIC